MEVIQANSEFESSKKLKLNASLRKLKRKGYVVFFDIRRNLADSKETSQQMERVAKAAAKSHKEKVTEFNQKLEKLSEHYDIPKVGPG